MHRLTVALLAAFDAVVAAAAGLMVALATLTAMFIFGFGAAAQWGALWPSAASIWQAGNLVPLSITLPDAYLAVAGIPPEAATFTVSLAPLAFAVFTVVFAARSGVRAAGAQAWVAGVLAGTGVYGAVAAGVALTATNPVAQPVVWQAIGLPAGLYFVAALAGAVRAAWIAGDGGLIDAARERIGDWTPQWRQLPGLLARGSAIVVMSVIGCGAAVVAVAIVAGGGQIIALSEAAHLDVLGTVMTALGAFAYLPTMVIWGLSWIAGPGFALGVGTSIGPGGTQVGVVPGLPVLGALPETLSGWLLLVVLIPVAAGAFAGWVQRSRFVKALDAAPGSEPYLPRVVLTGGTAVIVGVAAAALAAVASGGIGPGRFVEVGPTAGPVALAVGLEVLVGAAILLLSPRWRPREGKQRGRVDDRASEDGGGSEIPSDEDPADADGPAPASAARPVPAVVGADAVGRAPGAASAVRGLGPEGDDRNLGTSTRADDTATAPLDDDPPTDSVTAEPARPSPADVESDDAEPPDAEPADAEPPDAEPADGERGVAEPGRPATGVAPDPTAFGPRRPRPLPPVD